MRRTRALGATFVALSLVLSACAEVGQAPALEGCGDPNSGDAVKIGGVTDIGQLEDKSFNEGGWCGTTTGAEAVGGQARVIVTEETADYANNINTLVNQDFGIVVTYGFALGDQTAASAKEHTDVNFIGLDQPVCVDAEGNDDNTFACEGDAAALLPNYEGLIFNESQAGYLAGIVAATISETGIIGAVGGIDTIPAVVSYIGGYENGAKSVNPDIEVLISYVSEDINTAFNDPTTGRSLAEQMLGQDADVMFQVAGLSGQGALEAACDADAYGIGVDTDQALALPNLDCIVTSAEKKLVDAVSEAIQRARDGSAAGGTILLDAASDPPKVGVSPFHNHADLLTEDLQALLDEATAAMAAGELDACAGSGVCGPPFEQD